MNIRTFLKKNIVILDGGMGTLLQKAGLKPGELPERRNVTTPETIKNIHKDYFDAGSNVVNTNTFGANILKFEKDELEQIIKCAVKNAKDARNESVSPQEKFISLDVGPLGKLLKPFGELEFEKAVEIFKETVKLGVKYGVDLVTIETMTDSYETKAALLAVKETCNLPVFVSNAYSENNKLLSGADAKTMVALLEGMGADAVGLNCSFGPEALSGVAAELLKCASVPVIFKPNAGIPRSVDGKTVFDVSAEKFAEEVAKQVQNGVRVVGGCCGTTPEYIKLVAEKCKNLKPVETAEKTETVVSSYTHTVSFGNSPVLIGERINPTGKKRFKQALRENDLNYILNEGISQKEKGVHILDVNVGLPEIDEPEMLKNTVSELQAVIDLPLQIDTSDFTAMEKALRVYNGKPLINSVNGKKESMEAIFPLAKKYGGVIIALTLDENGIPSSSDGRVEIAKKILKTAEKYGINKKDIIFDTLAMTVSTDKNSALVTLESLKRIEEELGCCTSLGVSNVSFGLPERDIINSIFFALALQNGLSAAIINPFSLEIMKTYKAFCALHGFDDNCEKFIEFAGTVTHTLSENGVTASQTSENSKYSPLKNAIIKGLKQIAEIETSKLLETVKPLDIISEEIIPALDEVGKGFENKTVYLPQLLMSAESSKCAFEVIKGFVANSQSASSSKCPVVLATVKNDIHDIGKNIVKLLLENYGFEVYDLGKDVPPETVVEKAVELKAPVVGLSALMTTTVPSMEETVKLLKQKAPWCKTVVGGAVLTKEYADSIGADFYAKDAMETVRFAEKIFDSISK